MKLSIEVDFDIGNAIEQEFLVWFENNSERCKPLLLMGYLMIESGLTLYYDEKYKKEVEGIWLEKYEKLQGESQRYLQASKEATQQLASLKDVYEAIYEEKYRTVYDAKMQQLALEKDSLISRLETDLKMKEAVISADKDEQISRLSNKVEELKQALNEEKEDFMAEKRAIADELAVVKSRTEDELVSLITQRVEDVTRVKDVEAKGLQTQIEEIKKLYLETKSRCEDYEAKYNDAITSSRDDYAQFIKDEKMGEMTRTINKLTSELNVLKSTNAYKGAIGEKCVRDVISAHFTDCEVIDTSKTGGYSDVHVITKEGGIIAIESKNKASISNLDVSKSYTDIQLLKEAYGDKFIGYMFISHRTRNIPKKGHLHFEVEPDHGVPIIWYGVGEDENIEPGLVMLLKVLLCACRDQSKSKISEEKAADIETIMSVIRSKLESINDNIKLCGSLQENINVMMSNVSQLMNNNKKIYNDFVLELGIRAGTLQRGDGSLDKGGLVDNKNSLSCSICHKVFKRKCDLNNHVKRGH